MRPHLRLELATFVNEEAERSESARRIFDLLEGDVHTYWRLRAGRSLHGGRSDYERFREDVFVALFEQLMQLQSIDAFPFLFMTILESTLPKRQDTHPQNGHAGPGPALDPPAAVINQTLIRWYGDELPSRAREALELRFVNGLTLTD